jgi:arylformamidase
MDYESLSDAEIEADFNPRAAVANFEALLDEYVARSAAARERLRSRLDIAYGQSPLQTLDVFPADAPGAPLNVFIHGGYWRALDKGDMSFVAEPLVTAGATVVSLNYDLCPAVSLDDVVAQVRAAIAWVYRNAEELGGDRERLYVSGHSAGGDLIRGVAAVSGVYELAPVLRVSVNEEIGLTAEVARRNSPTLAPPAPVAPLLIAYGEHETPGWIQQSIDFHAICAERGVDCTLLKVPDVDHFSVSFALADPASPLCQAIVAQMGLA